MKIHIHMEEVKISNLLNTSVHDFLGFTPTIILTTVFCRDILYFLGLNDKHPTVR